MDRLTPVATALRAHDIHQGLHGAEIDRNSAIIARNLETTQLVGMAGALASWIKGREVVEDAQELKVVASEQLDIDPWAFDRVLEVLQDLDFVRAVEYEGGRPKRFFESVPLDHERMYERLGKSFGDRSPGEKEQALLASVDALSRGPILVESLDIAADVRADVLELGLHAEAIQVVTAQGQQIAYSPFFAFEQPEALGEVLERLDIGRIRAAYGQVRDYQGTPTSLSPMGDILVGLVGSGLMAGPAVERPDGTLETFAVAPYGLDQTLLTVRKRVLEKAEAIVAAVRMGAHFGGATGLRNPTALLYALLDPERVVARHSSTARQYAVLHNWGVVSFVKSGDWMGIKLVADVHGDNRLAVQIAIDMLRFGEAAETKGLRPLGEQALLIEGRFRVPIQAVKPAKKRKYIPASELAEVIEAAMGRRPVD